MAVIAETTLRVDLDLRESLGRRFQPQAIVVQEDRHLMLVDDGPPELDMANDHDAAYAALRSRCPLPLGRYLALRPAVDRPWWTYQAVVHDFEQAPTCRPGDVRRALTASVNDAVSRGNTVIATEPLGVHRQGGLGFDEMVAALDAALLEIGVRVASSLHITVLLDDVDELETASHQLRSHVLNKAARSFRTVDGDAAVVEVLRGNSRLHYRFVPGSLSGYMVARSARG